MKENCHRVALLWPASDLFLPQQCFYNCTICAYSGSLRISVSNYNW